MWVCTEAVESAVHRHLADQLAYLETRDTALYALIASIQDEELAHLNDATAHQTHRGPLRALALPVIGFLTDALIWLSTWGDSSWMRGEMVKARRRVRSET